jgi:hypothetical protein
MPHMILSGEIDIESAVESFMPQVHRWGRAVLKLSECWLRGDRQAMLVEGVVVELSRPLHPVFVVGISEGKTHVRLWPTVDVERTWPVQRLLAVYARQLSESTEGLLTTNIPEELWRDLVFGEEVEQESDSPGPRDTLGGA